jgi:hypothetical protein
MRMTGGPYELGSSSDFVEISPIKSPEIHDIYAAKTPYFAHRS